MKTELQTEVMNVMAQLPENADLDDLIYALRLRKYLQKGIDDLDAGRVWTTDQLQEHLRQHVLNAIEAGEADADAGRVYTSDEIRAEFKEISKLEHP
jgi:predicted transcriptional regulator